MIWQWRRMGYFTARSSRASCCRAECPPDVTGRSLRGFTYAAIGQLATRLPGLARQRVDVAAVWID